jgi:hypothetical protein
MSSGTIGFNNSAQSNVIEAVKFLFAGCDDASKAHRYFTFASYSKKTPTVLETIPPSIFPTDLLEFENSILFLSFVLIDRVLLRPLSHPMHRVLSAPSAGPVYAVVCVKFFSLKQVVSLMQERWVKHKKTRPVLSKFRRNRFPKTTTIYCDPIPSDCPVGFRSFSDAIHDHSC